MNEGRDQDEIVEWERQIAERRAPYETLLNEELTDAIIGAAIEVHRALGPGLLEAAYRDCLCRELELRNIPFTKEQPLSLRYKGLEVRTAYRTDIIVNSAVIVELKSVEHILDVHKAQLYTYMRLAQVPVGLILNFNVEKLIQGIVRRSLQ